MTTLHRKDIGQLIDSAMSNGFRFVAPVREENVSRYREVTDAADIVLDEISTIKSAKEYFLAEQETIMRYRFGSHGDISLENIEPDEFGKPAVVFGLRPCDSASLPVMNGVMTWDYDDNFFLERMKRNVVISIACVEADESCFCTSVGLTPDGSEGADILLKPTADETGVEQEYAVEAVTEKGKEFIEKTKGWGSGDASVSSKVSELAGSLAPKFDHEKVHGWLSDNFEHPYWKEVTVACIGCGTCTYLCPTCHCFDIMDEGNIHGGARVKNWDYCQSKLFTLHTSGHNPRNLQAERYRQRIQHKFRYYPNKFERILCTGCGRCVRSCPVDHSLLAIVQGIDKLASE